MASHLLSDSLRKIRLDAALALNSLLSADSDHVLARYSDYEIVLSTRFSLKFVRNSNSPNSNFAASARRLLYRKQLFGML